MRSAPFRHPTMLRVAHAALVAVALVGCSVCEDVGCRESVSLYFTSTALEPGDYDVRVSVGAEQEACSFRVPGPEMSCTSNMSVVSGVQEDSAAGANPPNSPVSGVSISGAPPTLHATVFKDSNEVLSESVTPVYDFVEPGGEGCGGCTMGRANLAL